MQYNKHKTYLLVAYLLAFSLYAQAFDKNYFEDSKRGWFWGETQPKEVLDKKEEAKRDKKKEGGKNR